MSQTEMAEKLGISRAYLSQIENGHCEPSLPLLKKIAKYFEIPMAVLLSDESDSNPELVKELMDILSDVVAARILLIGEKKRKAISVKTEKRAKEIIPQSGKAKKVAT